MLVMIVMMIIWLLLLAQLNLSFKGTSEFARLGSLESGFESLDSKMLTSSPFFFLAVLFVLFDLELLLLFPGVFNASMESSFFLLWFYLNFIILITLVLEWVWSGLKWHV